MAAAHKVQQPLYLLLKSFRSKLYNIGSLRSALTLSQLELYVLTFVKSLEAFALNSREVNKYILAILACDEAITLFSVEPLYCTLVHVGTLH